MAKSHSPFISITHKLLICNNNGQYLTLIHTNSTLRRGKDKRFWAPQDFSCRAIKPVTNSYL